MRGEEDDQGQGAVVGLKAAGRAHMEFKGSVEAFNKLFESTIGFGLFIEVLEADDSVMLDAG